MRIIKKKSRRRNSKPQDEEISIKTDGEISSHNLMNTLGLSKDVIFTSVDIGEKNNVSLTIVYIEGLIDKKILNNDILKPLLHDSIIAVANSEEDIIKHIEKGNIYCSYPKTTGKIEECLNYIISGSVALIFDNKRIAITFDIENYDKRAITEPTGENVVKGSKDAFVETLKVNTAIIRRKIKTPKLVIEETVVGKQTLTTIAIVYIDGITNRHIVDEIKKRLDSIDIDEVLATGFIEEFIIDNNYSLFPQVICTERSDKLCSHIVSGRVGLLIDGLPVTCAIPGTLNMFLHAQEDYSQNFWVSSSKRLLRYVLLVLTLLLPAFYVAITAFHQEMLPIELAIAIEVSKEGVPIPTFIEILVMLIAFEVLVEAGIRLPRSIGQTVSIVGALIVGEAAVNAKLISPVVVIVIAATAISGFAMPDQDLSNALRIWRLILTVFASIIGLFGVSIGVLLLLFHLAKLESFGVPYLSPFVAQEGKQMEDSIVRLPLKYFQKRSISLQATNKKRQG
ncbi:spore germination protein [Alkaliphilus pronyensis]|uniref:Spore germination protein n=1 Tax=Alkaliphilus pronyensis TaxID=1482732 RepID=A0A6I0EVZ7_9FIRM|nr:spore germination protein [Alkaliphilus pronyensis]KAB3530770.1 spore germination protein [Alkaliphilus pronyensis]